MIHYRQEIKSVPAAEQVEYLLDLLDYYLEPTHEFMAPFPGLSPTENRLVHALARRQGELVSKRTLMSMCYFDRPEDAWPEETIINVMVCLLRKKLKGFKIIASYGQGYKLISE